MGKPKELGLWVASVISTYVDLRDVRDIVGIKLREWSFEVQMFEKHGFPVEGGTKAHEACLFALNRADIVVLLVDKRYGGLFLGEGPYSITEMEYNEAIQTGKTVIPCIRREAWQDYEAVAREMRQPPQAGRSVGDTRRSSTFRYLEGWPVFDFIQRVTTAPHDAFLVLFEKPEELLQQLEGRISGLSRTLCARIVEQQTNTVRSRKTTTALVFSLGDVLEKGYFITPPYKSMSGVGNSGQAATTVIEQAMGSGKSILVLGEPGSGKSTLVAKAFLDKAASFKRNRDSVMPVYVSLRGRGASYHFKFRDFIADCCAEYFGKQLQPLFDDGKVQPVYFIDGLDELTEDMTALGINGMATKDFFATSFVVACRSRFAEDTIESHRFGERITATIKLQPWEPEQSWKYVEQFCKARGKPALFEAIKEAYGQSLEMADIFDNPLLLTLFLWIIEESRLSLPLDLKDRTSIFTEVIHLLSRREADRVRVLGNYDPEAVEKAWELAAWETYRAYSEGLDVTIEQLRANMVKHDPAAAALASSPSFNDLLDVDAHTTFVRGMLHELLWEYLIASSIARGTRDGRYPFAECLGYVNRVEINRFVRELWARESSDKKAAIVERLRGTFEPTVKPENRYVSLRRSHAAYYLGRMPVEGMADVLRALDTAEADIMVKLSIGFGLVKLGDRDVEERLWQALDGDSDWDAYNRGYHLVYYRDWSVRQDPPPYADPGDKNWDRTFRALLRHLTSQEDKHMALRRIELLTVRRFIETRRSRGPVGTSEIEMIRKSMSSTRDVPLGRRQHVLTELSRLEESWGCFS